MFEIYGIHSEKKVGVNLDLICTYTSKMFTWIVETILSKQSVHLQRKNVLVFFFKILYYGQRRHLKWLHGFFVVQKIDCFKLFME